MKIFKLNPLHLFLCISLSIQTFAQITIPKPKLPMNTKVLDFSDLELTGVWKCNDGAFYWITQKGNRIYWYGEHNRYVNFSNVYQGQIGVDKIVQGKFYDVPLGGANGHGILKLQIIDKNTIKKLSGNFGGSEWKRDLTTAPAGQSSIFNYRRTNQINQKMDQLDDSLDERITGLWRGSDNGIYYFRQVGEDIVWYGDNSLGVISRKDYNRSTFFTNVGFGKIRGDTFTGMWLDVPRGVYSNSDKITLNISDNKITKIAGGRFVNSWEKIHKWDRCYDAAYADKDGDGVKSYDCGGDDCDDNDPNRFPGNPEQMSADGTDFDCNPRSIAMVDKDGDGFIDMNSFNKDTKTGKITMQGRDCDDNDPSVRPTSPEVCDGKDNNCNGDVDEGVLGTYYEDKDGDRYGNPKRPFKACRQPAGYASNNRDCDDTDSKVYNCE